jgi:hypothetical protein
MAKDPEEHSEYEGHDESEGGIAGAEAEEVTGINPPICPRCGWRNTRLSHTRSVLDPVLRAVSLRAFRCRSCGNRFRAFWRAPRGAAF